MGDITMALLFKHITKDLIQKKSMIVVLFLFTIFISFLYFFVHFSIDKNLLLIGETLGQNGVLTVDEEKYYIALQNNQMLIRNITFAMISIFSFILYMFMRYFIRKNENKIGQIITLGFSPQAVIAALVLATACFSIIGSLIGLILGYFGSSILINANMQTYLVDGIIKGISIKTLLIGTLLTTIIFCMVTYASGIGMGNKDIAMMIKSTDKKDVHPGFIEAFVQRMPIRDKFKFKLTMKNISAVFLLLVAIVTFNIMFVLSVSLIFSGNKILESQTIKRDYTYDISYESYKTDISSSETEDIYYLKSKCSIELEGDSLQYNIVGLDKLNSLYQLVDRKNNPIDISEGIILNPELGENYGIQVGDMIHLTVEGESYTLPVSAIAMNADLKTIYLSKQQLATMLQQDSKAYNGVLTKRNVEGGTQTTFEEKIDSIQRGLTSNKASAIINQSIGVITGCLLIYLALLIGLNNNIKSILIFDLLGYDKREVSRILLNPYLVVINIIMMLTLPIGIFAARSIQIMTSIQTNDYMPFQVNIITVVYMLLILNLLCLVVRVLFAIKIRRIINAEQQAEFLYEW